MKLIYKRHFHLIIILISGLVLLTLVLGNTRVIAYTTRVSQASNELGTTTKDACINGKVDLFDESLVHSVQVKMTSTDLQTMVNTYQETNEKDYFEAEIVIDGVTIHSVGVRLKGNASLRGVLGNGGGEGGPGGGQNPGNGNRPAGKLNAQNQNANPQGQLGNSQGPQAPAGVQIDQTQDDTQVPPGDGQMPSPPTGGQFPAMQENPQIRATQMVQNGQDIPEQGMGNLQMDPNTTGREQIKPDNSQNPTTTTLDLSSINFPLKIKFDKFVEGQCFQGLNEINIRTSGTGSDAAMIQEPLTNEMVRLIGLPATRTVFTGFKLNDGAERLLVISELVNEDYLERFMDNPDGILYKAEMGSSLTYKGDDPSSYAKSFSQETQKKNADSAPLIEFAKFLTESDEVSFEQELPDRLDVDSFASYLAINNLLVNKDSMADMNNNYYLYYDDIDEKFTVLMWDANESLGKLGGGSQSANYDLYFSNNQQGNNRMPGGGKNILIQRFLENTHFKALYEEKLSEAYQKVFVSGSITDQVNAYADLLRDAVASRNLVELEKFNTAIEKDLSFISQRYEYLLTTDLLSN